MLTTVILQGELGKKFGRKWELAVTSVPQAMRLIDANARGFIRWIRDNRLKYCGYKVVCEFEDGRKETISEETYLIQRKPKKITFVPVVTGSSAALRTIIGVALIVVALANPEMIAAKAVLAIGANLAIGGVIEMLTPIARAQDNSSRKDKTSYIFDGPVNTVTQGVPVPLIYGQILTGSHPISVNITVDEVPANG